MDGGDCLIVTGGISAEAGLWACRGGMLLIRIGEKSGRGDDWGAIHASVKRESRAWWNSVDVSVPTSFSVKLSFLSGLMVSPAQ